MSFRHSSMPSGQNAMRSLESGEDRAASESRAECRVRRDQQRLTALWLGRSVERGAKGTLGRDTWGWHNVNPVSDVP